MRAPATTTLTYVYADQTAVVGPLATYAEPHAYDLCDAHSERLSAPRGLGGAATRRGRRARPASDDLLALADAVREAAAGRARVEVPRRPGRPMEGPAAGTCGSSPRGVIH